MAVVLRIVEATDPAEDFMSPKVLTESHQQRLRQLNNVSRALRALGYQLARASANDNSHPTVEIEPGVNRSTKQLLAMSESHYASIDKDGTRTISIIYSGVRVVWREGAQASKPFALVEGGAR